MSEQLGWGQGECRSCGEGRNRGRAGDLSSWTPDVLGFHQSQHLAGSGPGSGCSGVRGAGSCEGLLAASVVVTPHWGTALPDPSLALPHSVLHCSHQAGPRAALP